MSTEDGNLRKRVEYLKGVYRTVLDKRELEPYVGMDYSERLTYTQLIKALKFMPKGRVSVIGAITSDVLEVSGNRIISVILLHCRVILKSGMVPGKYRVR